MTRKLLVLVLLISTLLPLQTTEALSLAYLVTEQHLTLELATDGSAKIEDRIHYSGPENFNLSYTIYQPSTMKEDVSENASSVALNLEDLNLEIEVINLETGDSQQVEMGAQEETNHYYASPKNGDILIDLQMTDYGGEYGLVFHYDLTSFVTNYQDAAVIDSLKAAGGPIQQYTTSTVRVILPGGLDFSAEAAELEPMAEVESEPTVETDFEAESEPAADAENESKSEIESESDSPAEIDNSSNISNMISSSLPIAPNPSNEAAAHFSEKLPGDFWVWIFYAEDAQLTLEPGEEQTVLQIYFPKIGLSEPTEIQVTVPIERFTDNPQIVSESILESLSQTNRERMATEAAYEDIW